MKKIDIYAWGSFVPRDIMRKAGTKEHWIIIFRVVDRDSNLLLLEYGAKEGQSSGMRFRKDFYINLLDVARVAISSNAPCAITSHSNCHLGENGKKGHKNNGVYLSYIKGQVFPSKNVEVTTGIGSVKLIMIKEKHLHMFGHLIKCRKKQEELCKIYLDKEARNAANVDR